MDGSLYTFAYDPTGNRTTMADDTGVTTYTYDALSRLTGKTDPGPLVQSYGYDAASQRTTLVDPDGGVRTYSYDTNGRIAKMEVPNGNPYTYQYDADGRVTTLVKGDTGEERSTYDSAGQLLVREYGPTGSPNIVVTYTYDGVGNPLTRWDSDDYIRTWSYDAVDQFTFQDLRSGGEYLAVGASYDSVGNMLTGGDWANSAHSYDIAGRQTTMTWANGSQLVTFAYDDNGNLVSSEGAAQAGAGSRADVSMTYDYENRLIMHLDHEDGKRTTYTYSADGLKRSARDKNNVLTTFVWDGEEYLGEV